MVTRFWMLQEIALNPSSALIYYGDKIIKWDKITRAMDIMRNRAFDHFTMLCGNRALDLYRRGRCTSQEVRPL
jgi:hypothetical protein